MKLKIFTLFLGLSLFCLNTIQSQTRSEKRGLAYDFPVSEDIESIYKGVSWFYNWAYLPAQDENIPETIKECDIMYIPMAWNGGIQIETLRQYYRENPQVKYLLGFNEPNFIEQANMTPTAAAAKWPVLEEIAREFGLKIIGPAVNYGPNGGSVSENGIIYSDPVDYLDAFFAACPDCQVDYIALHCYMSTVSSLKSFIDRFRKYDKPIWLTEFCAWDDGTTEVSQRKYMADAVNYLETDPIIDKYSWFIGRWATAFPYMQTYGRNPGQLTNIGEVYVNMSSFDKNFYFTANDTIPAEHYIEVSDGIHLEKTTDNTGIINVTDLIVDRWVAYNIDIVEAGEYEIFYRASTNRETSGLVFSIGNNTLATEVMEDTWNVWKTFSFKAYLEAGKQKLHIKSEYTNVNLNWLKISPTSSSSIEAGQSESFKIHPNPTTDFINIETPYFAKYTLSTLTGKIIDSNEGVQKIDMTSFSQGIYLLTIQFTDGTTKTEKILKK